MEQKDIERLAVAQALYGALGELVSTKDGGNLRAEADAHYLGLYEQSGAKSFVVRIGDAKVGTYSVRVKPAELSTTLEVDDMATALAWAAANGCATIDHKRVAAHFALTGEVPDGFRAVTSPKPERVDGGTLKIDRAAVASAVGGALPETMERFLLGEGEERDA